MFCQLARVKRSHKANIVLDLQPESYKLIKLKEDVLNILPSGTRLHMITAIWSYVLLLEVAYRLLDMDKEIYQRNHNLFEAYVNLKDVYYRTDYDFEGDFSEKMTFLLDLISEKVLNMPRNAQQLKLNANQVTEIIHRHPLSELMHCITRYLNHKEELWILIDHLDKG